MVRACSTTAHEPAVEREKPSRALCSALPRQTPRREGLAPKRRLAQRERERERRVSDADASYYATNRGARTPKHVIPKRNHAKNNSLSKKRAGPSPKVPVKTSWRRPQRPTQNPTICLRPITQPG